MQSMIHFQTIIKLLIWNAIECSVFQEWMLSNHIIFTLTANMSEVILNCVHNVGPNVYVMSLFGIFLYVIGPCMNGLLI